MFIVFLVELLLSESSLLVKALYLFSKTIQLRIKLLFILLGATEDFVLDVSDLIIRLIDIFLRLQEELLPLGNQSCLIILD